MTEPTTKALDYSYVSAFDLITVGEILSVT